MASFFRIVTFLAAVVAGALVLIGRPTDAIAVVLIPYIISRIISDERRDVKADQ